MANEVGLKTKIKRESWIFFLLALPCIAFIFVFSYLPLWGWIFAFFTYKPGLSLWDCEYVGFNNFYSLFSNPILRDNLLRVLRNTFAMAGLGMLFGPLPIVFAIFLDEMRSNTTRRIVQSLATLPHFISWVIMYSLVFFMLSSNGFVNNLMISLGLRENPVNYLLSTKNVWLTMEIYGLWKGLGWSAIVYLAAISGIDQELYEAATIDGAGRFQRIWHIKVPGVIPTYFVLLILGIGNILGVGFERYFVFQNAMNKTSIEVLDLYVYNIGFSGGQISYSTAVGMMKSLVSLVLFTFANTFSKIIRGSSIF